MALIPALGAGASARAEVVSSLAHAVETDSRWVTGVRVPTDVAFAADGRAVITSKFGQVLIRRPDGRLKRLAYPFGGVLDTTSEKGLLGVVADPRASPKPAFYFYVSNGPVEDKHRVYRATLGPDDSLEVAPDPIIGASRGVGPGLEGPANHDGGGMVIHRGQLYVGVGDTGASASPPSNKYASCLNKGNGKILRVNLDGSVPSDNPLVGVPLATACTYPTSPWTTAPPDPRVFAWGLRNPWRFWLDGETGLLWIGDVGELLEEEISVGPGGRHYGYPFAEGSHLWGPVDGKDCLGVTPESPCTRPVFSYPRSRGTAVTGGVILDGCGWSRALGGLRYVFADSMAGEIRMLSVREDRRGVISTTPAVLATLTGSLPVSFRTDAEGSLFVVLAGEGAINRLSPKVRSGPDCAALGPLVGPGERGGLGGVLFAALGVVIAVFGVGLFARGAAGHSTPKPVSGRAEHPVAHR